MNKYKNIDIVDFEDDMIDRFVNDVRNEVCSVAIIGNKSLAEFALDSLTFIEYTPTINKVYFGDEGIYIVYVNEDYELYVQPFDSFKDKAYVKKVYIDADSGIKQPEIDNFLNLDTKIILFSVSDETKTILEGKRCDSECQNCIFNDDNVEISLKKENDKIHGFVANKENDNSYVNYSYYTSKELNKSDIKKMLKELGFYYVLRSVWFKLHTLFIYG